MLKILLTHYGNDELDLIKAKSILNQSLKSLDVSKNKSFSKSTVKDYIDTFKQEYNAKKKDKNFDKAVKTGYSYFDQVTGGLKQSELLLIRC